MNPSFFFLTILASLSRLLLVILFSSFQNICTRLLPKSTTIIIPSGEMQMPLGRSNSPGAVPFTPNLVRKVPDELKTWIRSFLESATIMLPSSSTATPFGRVNIPSSVPWYEEKEIVDKFFFKMYFFVVK